MNDLSHISFRGVEPAPAGAGSPRFSRDFSRPASVVAAAQVEMDPVMGWMLQQGGLNARAYRPAAMQRRLPACLRQLRVATPPSARALLERKPELVRLALGTILIGVSEFFRDRPVFEHLERVVLPELLRSRRGLRVCSAGASGGQELYSMAMLLGEQGGLENSDLLGVDYRQEGIASAAAGVFGADALAGVERARRERFFRPEGGAWRVRTELKKNLRWKVADLLAFDEAGPWDVILFRNVAIYFDEAHAAGVWERLVARLAPGGFLVTGKAEKPPASLPLLRVGPSVYQKRPS